MFKIDNKLLKILFLIIFCVAIFGGSLCILPCEASDEPVVVVIDPGHGGYDPGACFEYEGEIKEEKIFNLKIAQAIKAELTQYEGVCVYMTREENDITYMSIAARVQYAYEKGADLIVSVHNNSSGPTATGAVAMVPNSNYNKKRADESKALSSAILSKLEALGVKNNGFQYREYDKERKIYYPDGSDSDYYGILRASKVYDITGVLIEYSFMSNESDLEKLCDDKNLEAYGKATATAIAEKYGLKKGQNTEKVNVTMAQTDRIEFSLSKTVYTYGEGPIELTATGGTGTGEYTFSSNTLDVIDTKGNLAYILGPGTCKLYANKMGSGDYGAATSYGNEIVSITVKAKDVTLVPSYTINENKILVKCTLTDYVSGDLPVGNVAVKSGNDTIANKSFKESDVITIELDKNEYINKEISFVFTPGNYDNYNSASCKINIKEEVKATSSPTPTANPTANPTAEPTSEPTAEPTPEPTIEPTDEPTAEPTIEPTPEPTAIPSGEPTSEKTAEPTAEPTLEPTLEPTAENTQKNESNDMSFLIIAIILCIILVILLIILVIIRRKE